MVSYKIRTKEVPSVTYSLHNDWVNAKQHQCAYRNPERFGLELFTSHCNRETEFVLEAKIYLENLPVFQYATYRFSDDEEGCLCEVSLKTEYKGQLLCKGNSFFPYFLHHKTPLKTR